MFPTVVSKLAPQAEPLHRWSVRLEAVSVGISDTPPYFSSLGPPPNRKQNGPPHPGRKHCVRVINICFSKTKFLLWGLVFEKQDKLLEMPET